MPYSLFPVSICCAFVQLDFTLLRLQKIYILWQTNVLFYVNHSIYYICNIITAVSASSFKKDLKTGEIP